MPDLQATDAEDVLSTELLIIQLYKDIRSLATSKLRGERNNHTLQTTALINEAYLRLQNRHTWINSQQFLAVAAETMRHVLIDHARKKLAKRRGGERSQVPLQEVEIALPMPPGDLLAIDESLKKLESECAQSAELCKMRIYLQMTQAEAADALNISKSTADRRWAFAKSYLFATMEKNE